LSFLLVSQLPSLGGLYLTHMGRGRQ